MALDRRLHGDANNNPASSGCTAEPVVITGTPHLKISKSPGSTSYTLGDTISFTVVVTNDGTAAAHNVQLSDTLPGSQWDP